MNLLSKIKHAELRSLRSRKFREKLRLSFVEGEIAVREILSSKAKIKYLLFSESKSEQLVAKFGDVLSKETEVFYLADAEFAEISDTVNSQGVLAVFQFPKFAQLQDLTNFNKILVFDGVQDPGNVGTLIRSASAFGVELIIALTGTAEILSPKVLRSAAGLIYSLKFTQSIKQNEFAKFIHASNFNVFAADMHGEDIYSTSFAQPWMLILGNEGAGISDEFKNDKIKPVKISHDINVDSLNVSVAGSVILSWIYKQGMKD